MGIFHLSEYEQVWNIVMYYVVNYGFTIVCILFLMNPVILTRYDIIESRIFIFIYLIPKMIFHICNSKSTYTDYLSSLNSEFWSGVYTLLVVSLMILFQILYIIKNAKKK